MILRELGHYLADKQQASRRDLALHFHTSEDAIEAMLGVWMRKGRVIRREIAPCSGGCCSQPQEVIFQWFPPDEIGIKRC